MRNSYKHVLCHQVFMYFLTFCIGYPMPSVQNISIFPQGFEKTSVEVVFFRKTYLRQPTGCDPRPFYIVIYNECETLYLSLEEDSVCTLLFWYFLQSQSRFIQSPSDCFYFSLARREFKLICQITNLNSLIYLLRINGLFGLVLSIFFFFFHLLFLLYFLTL